MMIIFDNQISYCQKYVGRQVITDCEKKKEYQDFFDLTNIEILKCENHDCGTEKISTEQHGFQ